MGREVGTRISREFVATELVWDMISMPARYPKQDILHGIEIIEAVERIGAPAVPELSVAVDDEDETTRRWAARALGESGTAARPSIPVLVRRLGIESDATVRDVLVIAIGSIGVPLKHEEALINVVGRLLREGKLSSWRNGGWLYSVLGDRAVAYWVDSLSSGSFDQRRSAVYSLLQTNLDGRFDELLEGSGGASSATSRREKRLRRSVERHSAGARGENRNVGSLPVGAGDW